VSVVFAASEVFNWLSVAASVPNVVWNALSWSAVRPVVATGADGATATGVTVSEPVPAIEAGIVLGVPASTGGIVPACISRLANVAFATSSCC
jgi:hypothetical protein